MYLVALLMNFDDMMDEWGCSKISGNLFIGIFLFDKLESTCKILINKGKGQ